MRQIRTMEDLVHVTTELLTLVSSHAQYLEGREDIPGDCRKDVEAIIFETRWIAGCLAIVPPNLRTIIIRERADDPAPDSGSTK